MLDLQVDILMSRDLDSLINERESAAVTEWIKSPYALHVMRDHPLHKNEILGGLFGIKLGTISYIYHLFIGKGPFKYYVIKEVGGLGQKMVIFTDLQ